MKIILRIGLVIWITISSLDVSSQSIGDYDQRLKELKNQREDWNLNDSVEITATIFRTLVDSVFPVWYWYRLGF